MWLTMCCTKVLKAGRVEEDDGSLEQALCVVPCICDGVREGIWHSRGRMLRVCIDVGLGQGEHQYSMWMSTMDRACVAHAGHRT